MSTELDREVAEKLMGIDVSKYPIQREHVDVESRSIETWKEDVPAYSSNISAAFQVIEKMRKRHDLRIISDCLDESENWHVLINGIERYGTSLPECICTAALAALHPSKEK